MTEPTQPRTRPADPIRSDPPAGPAVAVPGRVVSVRSVLIGLAGVAFICGLTPFNDYALNNTFLVGSFLPIGLVLLAALLVLAINAPLHRFAPRLALESGELAVIVGMMLVCSTLPSSGLMRYLPTSIVALHHQAAIDANDHRVLSAADLPDWLMPEFDEQDLTLRGMSDLVQQYRARVPPTPLGSLPLSAIPFSAWVRPAITWGVFLAFFYGAILCLTLIVRRQWAENERLAFPLATVYQSLIEPPPPGRMLNGLFSSGGFWIAFGAVFLLHGISALHLYAPAHVPPLSLAYDFNTLLSEDPWRHLEFGAKAGQIYFVIIGITFLLQTRVAFSLWFFYVVFNVLKMIWPGEYGVRLQQDQSLGAAFCLLVILLWIGRSHWWLVIRQMARGEREGEPSGGYLSYRVAGWSLVGCVLGMSTWLWLAGMTPLVALGLALLMLMFITLIARVVCETGLVLAQLPTMMTRPWTYALLLPATPIHDTPRNVLMSNWMNQLFVHDMRESLMGYSTTAVRTADLAAYDGTPRRRSGRWFVAALALALLVGFVVSGASTLWVEYRFASTLTTQALEPLNNYAYESTGSLTLYPTYSHLAPQRPPGESHSQVGHFSAGVLVTACLSALRMLFAWWPLHPVGYLVMYAYPVQRIWLSLFIGWLLKALLVRFGGASMIRSAKPAFLGLVFGEVGAAAFWLVVSLVMFSLGLEYQKVSLLPE
jgi:hypothetical protein